MRSFAILTVAITLAACAEAPPTPTVQNGRVWEHRCPAAGTVVQTSNGGSFSYAGPAGPGLCRRTDGRFAIYGIWLTDRGQGPGAGVVQWLGSIFPASAGRSAVMQRTDRAARSQDTYMWIREARVVGFEALNLGAGQVDAILLEWTDTGTDRNIHRSRHRRWLDTQTGALVKSESRILGGNGTEHAWEAVSITAPRQRPASPAPTSRAAAGPQPSPTLPAAAPAVVQSSPVERRLRELQDLRARGLITSSEFEAARQRILRDL